MKNFFLYLLIFIPLISFGQDVKPLTDEQLLKLSTAMGELHNKGLEGGLIFLNGKYGERYSEKATLDNRNKLISELNEFIISFVETNVSVQGINVSETIDISNYASIATNEFLESDIVNQIQSSDEGKKISKELILAFNSLEKIMNDENLRFEKNSYDDLLNTTLNKLASEKEKIYLSACTGIGYSSLTYWRDNITKWEAFFGRQEGAYTAKGSGTKRNIATADVSGVIVGGVGGCVYGAIGGTMVFPGVGTLTGCAALGSVGALTGSLGGSLTAAVNAFVDWLFG